MKHAINTTTKPSSNPLLHRCGIRLTTLLRDHAISQPDGLSSYIRKLIIADMIHCDESVNNANK